MEVVVFKSENLEEIENLKLCGHEAKVTAVAIHGEEGGLNRTRNKMKGNKMK